MNSPFDAPLNRDLVSGDETERESKRPVEKFSPPPLAANGSSDENEGIGMQMLDNFLAPDLSASWSVVQESMPQSMPQEAAGEDVLPRMLVVDDLPVNRKLIGIQLQKLGYEVDQAENGLAALEKIKKEEYALVFMDLDMPVMDGYQAAIEIRLHDLETRQHTPIIALSSYCRQIEKERCISSGMDDLISKGISSTRLNELVKQRLRKKQRVQPVGPVQTAPRETGEIDIQLLLDTHGKIDEQVVDLSLGAMKTFIGCLSCALDDRDLASVKHFAQAMKIPCNRLGLKSMTKLSLRILADASSNNYTTARQGMVLLESQYNQILDQLTGLSACLHRVDENPRG